MRILLTGADGFIGSSLQIFLRNVGYDVVCVVRKQKNNSDIQVDSLKNLTKSELKDFDVVVHLAGRAHVMHEKSPNPLEEFRKSNTETTVDFAKNVARAGIPRFIFMSSIKVNGEFTVGSEKFKHDDKPNPMDEYAISKYEAEKGLWEISKDTGMNVIVIRPPLVYGPGAKGNFMAAIKMLQYPICFPLGGIRENRRSLVAIDNLCSVVKACIELSSLENDIFLVSDDEDISTADLFERLSINLGYSNKIFYVPPMILKSVFKLFGLKHFIRRLMDSLQVDISHTKEKLNWSPVISVDEALHVIALTIKSGDK